MKKVRVALIGLTKTALESTEVLIVLSRYGKRHDYLFDVEVSEMNTSPDILKQACQAMPRCFRQMVNSRLSSLFWSNQLHLVRDTHYDGRMVWAIYLDPRRFAEATSPFGERLVTYTKPAWETYVHQLPTGLRSERFNRLHNNVLAAYDIHLSAQQSALIREQERKHLFRNRRLEIYQDELAFA